MFPVVVLLLFFVVWFIGVFRIAGWLRFSWYVILLPCLVQGSGLKMPQDGGLCKSVSGLYCCGVSDCFVLQL